MSKIPVTQRTPSELSQDIKRMALELGFQQTGITDADLGEHIDRYKNWLNEQYHGEMGYMESHGDKRWMPHKLIEGTLRVISVRMNYLDKESSGLDIEQNPRKAVISRYALGRDYHKTLRSRLKKLISGIRELAEKNNYRAFVDSAPVLERALAQKSGLGWFGKNTMLINREAGSWFFLGEIYTDLPLELDQEYAEEHCGSCTACLDECPTKAFKGPYLLDSRRCISYLTIELKGSIPEEFRPLMGNRIYGCDDCQLVCPWTKFSQTTAETDFSPRKDLHDQDLLTLFAWSEDTFLSKTEGSPIRRAGYESWLRNIAIALGNAPYSLEIMSALQDKQDYPSEVVREHVEWAMGQQTMKAKSEN